MGSGELLVNVGKDIGAKELVIKARRPFLAQVTGRQSSAIADVIRRLRKGIMMKG